MFVKKFVKIVHTYQSFLHLKTIRHDKTILRLENDKIRIVLLISCLNKLFLAHILNFFSPDFFYPFSKLYPFLIGYFFLKPDQ